MPLAVPGIYSAIPASALILICLPLVIRLGLGPTNKPLPTATPFANTLTTPLMNTVCVTTFVLTIVLKAPTGLLKTLAGTRSEEHTSELQSRGHLVCRLLLEKKK